MAASSANLSLLSKPSTASSPPHLLFNLPKTLSANPRPGTSRFKCSAGQIGFFTRLGRLIKEKAKSDVEKVFSGFSKTRENLAVIDELLLYWNLADTDKVLDELEELRHHHLLFNLPKTLSANPRPGLPGSNAGRADRFFTRLGRLIKEKAKSDVEKVFSGFSKTRENLAVIDELLLYWNLADTDKVLDELEEDALKKSVLELITTRGSKTELQLGFRKPAVVIIVGVNGGGKTTSLGYFGVGFLLNNLISGVVHVKIWKIEYKVYGILMAAGDTFRAAASDQLEIWAERTGCEIVVAEKDKAKASSVLSQAVKRGKEQGFDVVLCDTSGRLHTNFSLMEELIACKKAVGKIVPGAPNEILLVLDGTTGLNMLPQAREFNEVVGITGLILTKLDGSARGGCVVSVVDELGIPVKFVGVGEGVEDLQPFDAEAFVNAIFS
ncbi:cell division protein ftsy like protein [Quercus suber]|uniref:Cell division protein ftsy like protein n=1 Tax=Quercus suber TaxID=58331 RepID=A0AAW0MEX4_QUESU